MSYVIGKVRMIISTLFSIVILPACVAMVMVFIVFLILTNREK